MLWKTRRNLPGTIARHPGRQPERFGGEPETEEGGRQRVRDGGACRQPRVRAFLRVFLFCSAFRRLPLAPLGYP